MKTRTWLALLGALAVIALAVVIVGSGDDDDTTSASVNATDAAFIADMTAHHQGAIEMAELAQKKADHAEIRTLAVDIVSAQKGEITTMKHIAEHLPAHETGGGHMGMSDAEMGMDMAPAMLNDAEPFDRAFIDMMVPHHEGAVAMAERLLEDGEHRNLRAMAQDIISGQTREIGQMKRWRKAWYGSARVPTARSGHGSADDTHMGG